MKILFFCQSINRSDPVIGDTIDRVMAFSRQSGIDRLDVLAIRGPEQVALPKGNAYSLCRSSASKLVMLVKFYGMTLRLFSQHSYHYIYLYMTPTIAPLFWPYQLLTKVKIASWFAHTIFRWKTQISLKYFTHIWFSVDEGQSQFSHPKKFLVGQGVDTQAFHPLEAVSKKYDLITVGRVTPLKKLDQMIVVVAMLRDRFGIKLSLAIAGDAYVKSDKEYKKNLDALIETKDLKNQVLFLGSVGRDDLPKVLNESRIFLFTIPGGTGKAPLEALACGIPVLLSYPKAAQFLGEKLAKYMVCKSDDESIVDALKKLIELNQAQKKEMELNIRELTASSLSMDALFQRITRHLVEYKGSVC